MLLLMTRPLHRPFHPAGAAALATPHRLFATLLPRRHSNPPDYNVIGSGSSSSCRGGTTSRRCPQQQQFHYDNNNNQQKCYYHSTPHRRFGNKFPTIVTTFQALPLIHKLIKKNLHHMKIDTMTQVQHNSYRALTDGKDVNILSPPDTGKTLSFLLPFLNEKLKVHSIKKGIHCIFVTPDSHHASANYLFTSELLQLMGPNITVQSLYESYSTKDK
jgi:hypothetical protein